MRKLLNTLYVTKEEGYLSLDGENVVLSEKGKEIVRLPFTNLESIVCFNYLGCSPALMGKCCDLEVNLSFVSNSGRFLARVVGKTKGNVFSRIKQIEKFSDTKIKINLIKNTIRTKIRNTRKLIMRSKRDIKSLQDNVDIYRLP